VAQIVLDRLAAQFKGGEIIASGTEHGDEWARVRRDAWVAVATFLRDDPSTKMEMFIDLTCVDRFGGRGPGLTQELVGNDPPRFDVVVHLYSVSLKYRVRLYCGAPEDDAQVDTLVPVWAGADWFEREAYDLYGVRFKGHPDLRRILMYPEFVGHPLRKDYPKEKRQPLVRRQTGMPE
jgi:NADH-quinone oxidoreductase subunit C